MPYGLTAEARPRGPPTAGNGSSQVTEEHAAWFTELIKDDLPSATLVAQACYGLAGRRPGARPAAGRPAERLEDSPSQGTAAGLSGTFGYKNHLRVRPVQISAPVDRRGQGRKLAALVPRGHIPVAERLYNEYTEQDEE
jgi:hypothetical protein